MAEKGLLKRGSELRIGILPSSPLKTSGDPVVWCYCILFTHTDPVDHEIECVVDKMTRETVLLQIPSLRELES